MHSRDASILLEMRRGTEVRTNFVPQYGRGGVIRNYLQQTTRHSTHYTLHTAGQPLYVELSLFWLGLGLQILDDRNQNRRSMGVREQQETTVVSCDLVAQQYVLSNSLSTRRSLESLESTRGLSSLSLVVEEAMYSRRWERHL